MMDNDAQRLHDRIGLVGLRAQATAVGLVQLSTELLRAGVLDDDAIGRIKDAIATDILVSNVNLRGRRDFEESLRKRLDAIFATKDDAHEREKPQVGHPSDIQRHLGLSDGDAADS